MEHWEVSFLSRFHLMFSLCFTTSALLSEKCILEIQSLTSDVGFLGLKLLKLPDRKMEELHFSEIYRSTG